MHCLNANGYACVWGNEAPVQFLSSGVMLHQHGCTVHRWELGLHSQVLLVLKNVSKPSFKNIIILLYRVRDLPSLR